MANPLINTGSFTGGGTTDSVSGPTYTVPIKCTSGDQVFLAIAYASRTAIGTPPSNPAGVGVFSLAKAALAFNDGTGGINRTEVWMATASSTLTGLTNSTVTLPATVYSSAFGWSVTNFGSIGAVGVCTNTSSPPTGNNGAGVTTTANNSLVIGLQENDDGSGIAAGSNWSDIGNINDANFGQSVIYKTTNPATPTLTTALFAGALSGTFGAATFEIKPQGAISTNDAINDTLACTALTGTLQAAQFPALTGDITNTAGSLADTLATVNSNVGSFTKLNVTVNGKGLVTAASTGGSGSFTPITETVITGTSQAGSTNNSYASNNASLVTITLPSTFAVGDEFEVQGLGAGGWLIAQNSSQLIHFGNLATTTGATGSLASTNAFDTISLKAVVANTTLVVLNAQGNITVV